MAKCRDDRRRRARARKRMGVFVARKRLRLFMQAARALGLSAAEALNEAVRHQVAL